MSSYNSQAVQPVKSELEPEYKSVNGKNIIPFQQKLLDNNLKLERGRTNTLQVNVGLKCNQYCTHCHLDAGPSRKEMMSWEVMEQVADFANRNCFDLIDITGGAPELHSRLEDFIALVSKSSLSKAGAGITLRSNLSTLYLKGDGLTNTLKKYGVNLIVSFPSLDEIQTESLRGKGVFKSSINSLIKLNELGYGKNGSDLSLDLVVNPSGAFLSPSQDCLEKKFKDTLLKKWGIQFNSLFGFANMPLGRFRSWLINSNNFDQYMEKLVSSFNPLVVDGLMCRSLLSVSWDGYLYDCDFNQAANLPMNDRKIHISEMSEPPEPGNRIAVGNHCYTCTAGVGFT